MEHTRIHAEKVSIRFRLYYERSLTLRKAASRLISRSFQADKAKYYTALDDVSFKAHDGDIIGIIGPNGGGKSTLLRCVSGIYHPDAGEVRTNGVISMLLSLGTGFDNNLSGLDNIRLNGLIMGMSPEEIDAQVEQIADFAEIGEYINVPMHYYSSGMISRLSFSIVLAMHPDILVIDEVFSVGDLAFQKKSERAMHTLLSRASCQLIVTHNLQLARNHCNRVLYINQGRLIADGDPQTVVDQYKSDMQKRDKK